MDNEPEISSHFGKAVWSYVQRDIRAVVRGWRRLIIEGTLMYAIACSSLVRLGSVDAATDMSVERLVAIPLTGVLMLIHVLWSWATARRRIFKDQKAMI